MKHDIRWTAQKIGQRLALIEPLVYRRHSPLPPFRFLALSGPEKAPQTGPEINDESWPTIEWGSYWGAMGQNFVLRTRFSVPSDWTDDFPTALFLPLGEAGDFSHPEALAYIDGRSFAACDRHHQEIILSDGWGDGKEHLLALHGWTGPGGGQAHAEAQLFMQSCALVQIDQPTRDFIATARVALGIANKIDENEPARGLLLNALDDAFKLTDIREPFNDRFYESIGAAHRLLRDRIAEAGPPLPVELVATGHAHIDVAWLWTLGQTRQKAIRTFHTVLRLMEQFPDYHFTQSQPQLYDSIAQDHPALLTAIQACVSEGRWEPIGGMWVEADCNLSGPESLARQFLYGRALFRDLFGPEGESPVLWLPDVFGYSSALPQLMKLAGMEYFFTIKIGWNQYNRLPYDSFWWQGLDGTRVLTHFSTTPENNARFASTYNAQATPAQIIGTWTNFQQKELQRSLLMAFGYGDGGGGPTREMLENLRETANFPATPQTRQGSVADFFQKLDQEAGPDLPVWNGELYLELHRGTYTTQSRNKRANRKAEFQLHDAEFLATLAHLVDSDYLYPSELLIEAWKLVCLNQFHDIIPGSSITAVYEESLQQYRQVTESTTKIIGEALNVIARYVSGDLLVVNPTPFAQNTLVSWSGELGSGHSIRLGNGQKIPTQVHESGMWIFTEALPAYSVTGCSIAGAAAQAPDTGLRVSIDVLENRYIRVELNERGDITRIFDRENRREVLPAGAIANEFQAFEDRPLNWDAWDIDVFYDDKMWLAEPAAAIAIIEAGPLRATLEIRRRILNSDYVQRLSLNHNSPQLDFDTAIEWAERHVLLKVAFPLDILSPAATYEIQWGNVERPTHKNTSWDWARFESCAQKWVDLSEGGYGVSLLNDCKYGHDIHDNTIRLSLLRGPTIPDPQADQGQHRFVYSLLPHAGKWNETTVAAAYALNDPLIVYKKREAAVQAASVAPHHQFSLFSVDASNVVVETIKRAEDGNGIIIRLYESRRMRGPVKLRAGFPIERAWMTNLLEENQQELEVEDDAVMFTLRPFQIITIRLVLTIV